MAREWIQYPKDIEIATAFGPVFLNVVEADYVYVDASGNGKHITVAGKQYSFSLRLQLLFVGGVFSACKLHADSKGSTRDAVHARKYQSFKYDDPMPPSYVKKAVDEVIARVSEHLAANPQLTHIAAVADANNALAREEETLAKLEAQVAEQRKKVQDLARQLGRAQTSALQMGVNVAELCGGNDAEVNS